MSQISELISELLFPPYCINCYAPGTLLCTHCFQKINFFNSQIDIEPNKYLQDVYCVSPYEGITKKLITTYKYRCVKNISIVIARLIYEHFPLPQFDYLTFIPLHHKKLGFRGFNQSELIAKELSDLTFHPCLNLLIKKSETVSQASISDRKLRLFSANKFSLAPHINRQEIKDKVIIIFDDVTTTGSTLIKAAKVIKCLGPKKIIGLTLAHGQ